MAYAGTIKQNIASSSSCSQEELLRYILERDNLSLDGVVLPRIRPLRRLRLWACDL